MLTWTRRRYTTLQPLEAATRFWSGHPALYVALCTTLGLYSALTPTPLLLVPAAALFVPLLPVKGRPLLLLVGVILTAATYQYVETCYTLPQLPAEGVSGTGHFRITSVRETNSHGSKYWQYRGTLIWFRPDGSSQSILRHAPCSMRLRKAGEAPPLYGGLEIEGMAKEWARGRYSLTPHKGTHHKSVSGSWSLATLRHRCKKAVSSYLTHHVTDHHARNFLTGLATGEFGDRLLAMEFARFGLQHIMAISGFHFAIVAAMLQVALRGILPFRTGIAVLIAILASYYAFLGNSASIQRAWIAATVVLIGMLLGRTGRPLNTLGVALLAVLCVDPLQCLSLGFQFTFLVTAAILLFFQPCDNLLQAVVRKRRLSTLTMMGYGDQHAYVIGTAVRQSLALTMAVHLVAIPLMLFYFHKFPLMGLLYNLFFPFLTSIAMLLLLLGFAAAPIPPLAAIIHSTNETFTRTLLNTVFDIPVSIDYCLRYREMHTPVLVWFLTIVFAVGIALYCKQQDTETGLPI